MFVELKLGFSIVQQWLLLKHPVQVQLLAQADGVQRDHDNCHGDDDIPTMATGIMADTPMALKPMVTGTPCSLSTPKNSLPIEIQTVLPTTQVWTLGALI
jgi:hypothetical protein